MKSLIDRLRRGNNDSDGGRARTGLAVAMSTALFAVVMVDAVPGSAQAALGERDFHVVTGACQHCDPGEVNQPDDNPDGDNT